ncbi:MAG: hypothetical protein JO295_09350 [Verrucomicrobia bacterium]|nr:hypothetical protein [Verrucomicrobiota bacterium]
MKAFPWSACFSLLLLLAAAPATALHAQATKIFVASFGNDGNDGSRGSPKRNFQAAHDAVAAGGQIVVLDTAGFGALNITKSMSVTVPPGVNGFVSVTGINNAVTINASASATVSLRGLILEGGGGSGTSSHGILGSNVGHLVVEDCVVRNFDYGIDLDQSTDGFLQVHRGSVRGCTVAVLLQVENQANLRGIVTDCLIENNYEGLGVASGVGASATLTASRCVLSGNNVALSPFGSSAIVYADDCRAQGNTKVLNISDGLAYTLNNNSFTANGGSDNFTGSVPAH